MVEPFWSEPFPADQTALGTAPGFLRFLDRVHALWATPRPGARITSSRWREALQRLGRPAEGRHRTELLDRNRPNACLRETDQLHGGIGARRNPRNRGSRTVNGRASSDRPAALSAMRWARRSTRCPRAASRSYRAAFALYSTYARLARSRISRRFSTTMPRLGDRLADLFGRKPEPALSRVGRRYVGWSVARGYPGGRVRHHLDADSEHTRKAIFYVWFPSRKRCGVPR